MKIVHANKYYFIKGGAERYFFDVQKLLIDRGHDAIPFAMHDTQNVPSVWDNYFVSHVETRPRSFRAAIKTAARFFYSFEARRKFGRLLDATSPDLVHVHNIYHQISPSILSAAKRRGVPVVMTVNDYKFIAPNYSLYHDGAICERTKPDRYSRAVAHRCIRGSRGASTLDVAEMYFHKWTGLYRNNIDALIAPTAFVEQKLREYGVTLPITRIPYFIDAFGRAPSYGAGEYILFVGRLSPEKGVDVLIRAAAQIKDIPVHIVGTGPEEARLRALATKLNATNVVFRGFQSGDALEHIYAQCRAIVVPSVWYEVAGIIVLEAYAAGKPAIVSQIGGLAEMIKAGETGWYAPAGDPSGLAAQIAHTWQNPDECELFGRRGRQWVEQDFSPDSHYQKLLALYQKTVS